MAPQGGGERAPVPEDVGPKRAAGARGPRPGHRPAGRHADRDGRAELRATFAEGLARPFGLVRPFRLVFHDGFLYVGNHDAVVRFTYREGQIRADGSPEHYGWPFGCIGPHPEPILEGALPDLVASTLAPDVLLPAHSAALGLAFYRGGDFPAEYRGDAFVWGRPVDVLEWVDGSLLVSEDGGDTILSVSHGR